MAQFIGFKCDCCGKVIDTTDRNRVTIKFDGPAVQGEFTEDRCSECVHLPVEVPKDADLKPLRRRRVSREDAPQQDLVDA